MFNVSIFNDNPEGLNVGRENKCSIFKDQCSIFNENPGGG